MDAGKLDKRIEIKSITKTSDGYGGTTSTLNAFATVWAYVREVSGKVEQDEFDRGRKKELDIIVRSQTAEDKSISEDNILRVEGETGDYRVISIVEHTYKKYTKITAVKTF